MYSMTLPTTFTALLATVLLAPSSSYAQVSLSPAATAPQGASATVNPSFCAYAFEERSFYYYASEFWQISFCWLERGQVARCCGMCCAGDHTANVDHAMSIDNYILPVTREGI